VTQAGTFDAARIRELLTELGARLAARAIEARVFVVGGAAMALAYDRRRVTRDIDAVFEPKTVIYEEAAQMANELGLPPGWLNDGVKAFLPDLTPPTLATDTFSAPGINVGVASAEYMFAMKASASRAEADRDDLRTLIDMLGIRSIDAAFDIVERHYDRRRLTPKVQFTIQEVVAEALADRSFETK
jgi:predicted nucleotidyltransferase